MAIFDCECGRNSAPRDGRKSDPEIPLQSAKKSLIKQVRHRLIDKILHHNRAKTAGIFFIYNASSNQFLNI